MLWFVPKIPIEVFPDISGELLSQGTICKLRFRGELVLTSGAFKLGNLVTNLFYPSFRWIQFRVILVKNVPNS